MRTHRVKFAGPAILFTLIFLAARAGAQERNFDGVQIRAEKVAGGIYLLAGPGGNIALSTGDDGAYIVDDLFAPLTERIVAAIAEVTDKPVRFVVNTHWHGDHTGGNENFGEAGAVIVAHENVRTRMSTEQVMKFFNRTTPPSPAAALPVITFTTDLKIHLNGEEAHIFHVEHAHTDGDSMIYFAKSNVLHTGDTFFNGLYPFIDLGSGGTVDGVMAAADAALELVNAETRIIPGHGPVSDISGLKEYRRMLSTVRDRVAARIAAGDTLEETIAAAPTAEFDAALGGGFVSPAKFVEIVYNSLSGERQD